MKKGYFHAILSAFFFGMAGVLVKLALKTGLASIEIIILQYIISIPLLFLYIYFADKSRLKLSKQQLTNLAIMGIVGNAPMTIFYYDAFAMLPAPIVTIVLYTYPFIIFAFNSIVLKQKPGRKMLLIIFIGFIGAMLTLNIFSINNSYSKYGLLCAFLAAVFFAFMNMYSEKYLYEVDALVINTYSTLFSLIVLSIYNFRNMGFLSQVDIKLAFNVGLLSLFCEVLPLTLLYSGIKKIGGLKTSILGNLEIPTAIIFSAIILKEQLVLIQILGVALIIFTTYKTKKLE